MLPPYLTPRPHPCPRRNEFLIRQASAEPKTAAVIWEEAKSSCVEYLVFLMAQLQKHYGDWVPSDLVELKYFEILRSLTDRCVDFPLSPNYKLVNYRDFEWINSKTGARQILEIPYHCKVSLCQTRIAVANYTEEYGTEIKVYSLPRGDEVFRAKANIRGITALSISDDGRYVAVASINDGVPIYSSQTRAKSIVEVYDIESAKLVSELRAESSNGWLLALNFERNGLLRFNLAFDGQLLNPATGEIRPFKLPMNFCGSAMNPLNQKVVALVQVHSQRISVEYVDSSEVIYCGDIPYRSLPGHRVLFSHDGRKMLTLNDESCVLWDTTEWSIIRHFAIKSTNYANAPICVTPTGVALPDRYGDVCFLDFDGSISTIRLGQAATEICLNGDNNMLFCRQSNMVNIYPLTEEAADFHSLFELVKTWAELDPKYLLPNDLASLLSAAGQAAAPKSLLNWVDLISARANIPL